MRKSSILVVAALAAFCVGSAIQAAEFVTSGLPTNRYQEKKNPHPLAPQQITQNTDPNTVAAGSSIACSGGGQTTDNGWWRVFDLDGEFGLSGQFCTDSVDYGIESATGGPQTLTANVYCLPDGLPFLLQFLTLAGSGSTQQADAALEFFNVGVSGCCDTATQSMAVELLTVDCQEVGCGALFLGANGAGQTGPSFIAAADCGIVDPVNMANIGFPNSHMIMVVNGEDGAADGGSDGSDGGVPASSNFGMVLMLALLLGSSVYFLRRRATNN